MKLSIVATLYRSAVHLDEFHRRAGEAARALVDGDYELVLVNDGSPDASLAQALSIAARDPRVVVVDLSRNFGHHKAMMTGLAHARGDHVFLIDSDLEEDPAWLIGFSSAMGRCDVVYGVQTNRKGGWFERWSGTAYYRLMRTISGVDMPRNMVTARLMTRRYVDALLRHREREIEIGGLWAITGFAQLPMDVVKRSTSPSTYTLGHRVAVLVNSVTAFSTAPLVAIFYIGLATFVFAVLMAALVALRWMFDARPVSGWTSLIISVWLIGSMIMSFIGVVGIYLAKVLSEVKQRPYTIVREVHGRDAG